MKAARWLIVPVLVLSLGCGGGDQGAASTTAVDYSAFCRLMERTDAAFRGGDLAAQVDAERQRIEAAPPELSDEFAHWTDDESGVPNGVVAEVQDWVQEHCGFLPSFG